MYIIRPVSLLVFESVCKMEYPGIDKSQDGIVTVRRNSDRSNMWNGFPELDRVVVMSVILL